VRVHGWASQPHYAEHVAAALAGVPDGLRGDLFVPSRALAAGLRVRGVNVVAPDDRGWPMPSGEPVVVAGFRDVAAMRGRRVALLEHGAGQTYVGVRDGSYAGGRGRGRVDVFLCPSGRVADVNAAAGGRVEVVGCPRLDVLWDERQKFGRHRDGNRVAVSFHWRCRLTPECGSAWDAFKPDVRRFVAEGRWQVLGHGHPRLWGEVGPWWRSLGVEPVEDWTTVVRRADFYVCDNSSTMFEAAAVGLPVVVLTDPEWRRDVEHGLRFWEYADVGPELTPGDSWEWALSDVRLFEDRRREVVEGVYALPPDGSRQATVACGEVLSRWACE
jgi:hypothetical protein